ncbi:poly-beta-1,6-N-acetyl-D-glucosamine biosynthesis protein PgaD [Geoalkalibacter sp.]|uniref:poly-beta-1,6-N-acetyl-D-glucosamine biosynthesis protein PgaD n=1 Tax=Geoalkalibacter sp. TaxID=3041440 RepID=UPI00272E676E|nr:poly-beta-1,6-N-acetyl-D-glucosamine biosynthesis protein PgaD [Geoalkalibacter sp.]
MRPPIIENPKGATRLQRYSQGVLTGVFWVFLGLLLRPLLTLGAWLVGGHLAFLAMFRLDGLGSLFRVPLVYFLVVALIGTVLIGWSTYNLLRFRHNERRTRQPDPLTSAQLAGFFGVDEALVRRWQGSRRIVMGHDEQGRPGEG